MSADQKSEKHLWQAKRYVSSQELKKNKGLSWLINPENRLKNAYGDTKRHETQRNEGRRIRLYKLVCKESWKQ